MVLTSNTAFSVLYGKVITKLKASDSATTTRAKAEVNNAIREILCEGEWPFADDMDNFIIGTGSRKYSLSDDCDNPELVRVASQKTLGDTSTQIVVTHSGTTAILTYTGVGTDPKIGIGYMDIGDTITCTGFSSGNNVTNSQITDVGTNYVKITNAAYVEETKTNVVLKFICQRDAKPVRRTDSRKFTSEQSVAPIDTDYVTPTKYSIYDDDLGKVILEFSIPITNTMAIWYDYKLSHIGYDSVGTTLRHDLTSDTDWSVIPPHWDHVIVQLAYANMLGLDDDDRENMAFQRYLKYLKQMRERYFYSDGEMEISITPGDFIET